MTLAKKLGFLGTMATAGALALGCIEAPEEAVITSEEHPRRSFFGTELYRANIKFLDGREGYLVHYEWTSLSVDSALNVGDTITVVKMSKNRYSLASMSSTNNQPQ